MINIATDPCGNVYLMGSYYQGTFTLGSLSVSNFSPTSEMYFLAKISSSGNVIWLKNIAQETSIYSSAQNQPGGLGIDGDGNPYVSGSFNGANITIGGTTLVNSSPDTSSSDVFVAKYDTSGVLVWANCFSGGRSEYVYGVSATKNGDIYICGYFYSDTLLFAGDTLLNPSGGISASLFIAKYDKYGNPKWAEGSLGTTTDVSINQIAADSWNNVYMVGAYRYSFSFGAVIMPYSTGGKGFILKFDSSGNAKWEKTLSGTINSVNTYGVAADNSGNIWTSGKETGTETPLDLMSVAQYDTSGALLRSLSLTDGGDDQNGIAVDNRGNMYVGGDYMHNPFILGGDTLSTTGFGVAECLFIAKFSYPFVVLPPDTLSPMEICQGDSTILSPAFPCGTWSSSNPLIATINSASGKLTGVSAGTTTITYRGASLSYEIVSVSVNIRPSPIVGITNICIGGTTTLSDITSGGMWSSTSTVVAVVSSSSGVVSGMTAGTSIISYELLSGCATMDTISVYSSLPTITGAPNLCPSDTLILSDSITGGIWSNIGTSVATVGSENGVVTGVGGGTTIITYSIGGSCIVTQTVTVNPLPIAGTITGVSNVCVGTVITLNDTMTSGTWSSANPSIGTISGSGVVTGVLSGTTTISYTITNSCGVATATRVITVNPLPVASFSDTGTAAIGFVYTGSPTSIDSIVWNYGDGNSDTGMITFHTYTMSDTYQVCVTAYTPCGIDSSCSDIVIIGLGIPILSLANTQVFPNPANTLLTITDSKKITTIAISNLLGQVVYSHEYNAQRVQVDVADLPTGVYFIQVNGSEVRKFVKQ